MNLTTNEMDSIARIQMALDIQDPHRLGPEHAMGRVMTAHLRGVLPGVDEATVARVLLAVASLTVAAVGGDPNAVAVNNSLIMSAIELTASTREESPDA